MLITVDGSTLQTDLIYEITEISYSNIAITGKFSVNFLDGNSKTFSMKLLDDDYFPYNELHTAVYALSIEERKNIINSQLQPIRDWIINQIQPNTKIPTFTTKPQTITELLQQHK
jgi:hypothetical protein